VEKIEENSEPVKEEKVAFDVELVSIEASAKIKLIKEVRSLLGLGLKEVIYVIKAKEKVEKVPNTLLSGIKKEEA
jgi:large subunit ribosomal protein L7/L12